MCSSDLVTILLADSARLATTPGMKYLYLHLYKGEQFENLREQTLNDRNVPYRRESFVDKQVLIPFDANFNRLDEGGMRKQYVGKNIEELNHSIDSIGQRVDSMGKEYASGLRRDAMPLLGLSYDTPSAISAQRPEVRRSAGHKLSAHLRPPTWPDEEIQPKYRGSDLREISSNQQVLSLHW